MKLSQPENALNLVNIGWKCKITPNNHPLLTTMYMESKKCNGK
jgi:hypothetical protein